VRKYLFAATILVPFAAFADQPRHDGGQIAGNVALSASGSLAGVNSRQGTMANSMVSGNGSVINGAVAGNYTAINTTGGAQAGPKGSFTSANTTQLNVGGTITGGAANEGRGFGNKATGSSGATQSSQVVGGSAAAAANLGGFVKLDQPNTRNTHPGRH
jgi:hypothetical protein